MRQNHCGSGFHMPYAYWSTTVHPSCRTFAIWGKIFSNVWCKFIKNYYTTSKPRKIWCDVCTKLLINLTYINDTLLLLIACVICIIKLNSLLCISHDVQCNLYNKEGWANWGKF